MKEVAFGQYYPVDSFVHRLDPRFKLFFLVAFIAAIFVATNFYGLLVCAGVLVFVILFSRIPAGKVLRAVRGVLFLALFATLIHVFFYAGETVYWSYGIICISREGLISSAFLILRLALLVVCSSMLTYTTTPVALTDGIEAIFHVHVIARIMSIALRMIPSLMEETERVKNAQKARGADFESGNLFKRVKAFVPILIPLLLSAFRIAEDLGDAMESRCYVGGKKRTKYKKLCFSWRDLLGMVVACALVAGVVLLRIYVGATL